MSALKRTQLFRYHAEHGKLTEFAGFEMPLWYTTIKDEHLAVRNGCGIFDVSHMGRLRLKGEGSAELLERTLPTNVKSQPVGKAFYTLLLTESAGIMDDIVVMKTDDTEFLVVVNAANLPRDTEHILSHSTGLDAHVEDLTGESAMMALQGPGAASILQPVTSANLAELKRFRCVEAEVMGERCLVSRTGYTGEDGFEIIVYGASVDRPVAALTVWEGLARSAAPCGLGARDSLRLEAGYPLHGLDIDDKTDPFEAGLSWVMSADKDGYVGSTAVSKLRASPRSTVRRGMVLDEGIPRHGFDVLDEAGVVVGRITSGTFSPVLRRGIALAKVGSAASDSQRAWVKIRESASPGSYVKPPFYDERLYGWKRQSKSK